MRIVLPAKAHLVILQGKQAPVGDGHAMSVARQILKYLVWSTKGWFGIDYPFVLSNPLEP